MDREKENAGMDPGRGDASVYNDGSISAPGDRTDRKHGTGGGHRNLGCRERIISNGWTLPYPMKRSARHMTGMWIRLTRNIMWSGSRCLHIPQPEPEGI